MSASPALLPTTFSLGSVLAWGTSDFLGGYASRRANAFVLTTVAHASGLVLILSLAIGTHSPFPARASVEWALLGGISGGAALAFFYRALSTGSMGLTAPVAAVVGAAIPTAFGMFTEGFPGALHLAGFGLAGIGIWLISRTEDGTGPEGIGIAILAGVGFAGFYLCMRQAGAASAMWLATFSRTGALVVTAGIVLIGNLRGIPSSSLRWGTLAGCLDVMGTLLFVNASQAGRLDAAVVLTSLYPAVTVLLARIFLREHFTRWKAIGILAALVAVPMVAA